MRGQNRSTVATRLKGSFLQTHRHRAAGFGLPLESRGEIWAAAFIDFIYFAYSGLYMGKSGRQILVSSSCGGVAIGRAAIVRMAQKVLADHKVKSAQIDIAIIGDVRMRSLNRRYAGSDRITDVLSFDLSDPSDADAKGRVVCGQVVVNWHLARRCAGRFGHSAGAELMLYVVHGLLHLLGYDDQDKRSSVRMRAREFAILAAGGYDIKQRVDRQEG